MKTRLTCVAVLLALSSLAFGSGYDLTINLSDGRIVTFSSDDIRRLEFATFVSGVDDPAVPNMPLTSFRLLRSYPNPFNPMTTVEYEIPQEASVSARVFDLHGALVRELQDGTQAAGRHQVTWDGTDDSGARVASGIYFCTVECAGQALSRQLVLVK